jgi:hypothetical protein
MARSLPAAGPQKPTLIEGGVAYRWFHAGIRRNNPAKLASLGGVRSARVARSAHKKRESCTDIGAANMPGNNMPIEVSALGSTLKR